MRFHIRGDACIGFALGYCAKDVLPDIGRLRKRKVRNIFKCWLLSPATFVRKSGKTTDIEERSVIEGIEASLIVSSIVGSGTVIAHCFGRRIRHVGDGRCDDWSWGRLKNRHIVFIWNGSDWYVPLPFGYDRSGLSEVKNV